MNAIARQPKIAQPVRPQFTPPRSGLLQRKCECGGNSGSEYECEECRKKRLSYSRFTWSEKDVSGTTVCDPEQGKMVISPDYLKNAPICMADCIYVHEKAHADFGQSECAKISAVSKAAKDAKETANKTKKPEDQEKALRAVTAEQEALAKYSRWLDVTCRDDEQKAYQAGIDKCKTDATKQQCKDLQEKSRYDEIMKNWEKFKLNPPNCPQPPSQNPPANAPPPPAKPFGSGQAPPKRQCLCGGKADSGGQCEECRKQTLQRKACGPESRSENIFSVPPIVHEALRSPGQPLDAETRAFMEPRFGHDFGNVRVHMDAKAAESAREVNALAYTAGQDMVFGAGRFAPRTAAGLRLLAHELTHVLQQTKRGVVSPSNPVAVDPDIQLESDAEHMENRIYTDVETGTGALAKQALQRRPIEGDGKKPTKPAYITEIIVDQNTPEQVTATFSDGHTISDECSTGKGHCCFDDPAAIPQGGACSAAHSTQVGNNCTPIGDFTVTAKIPVTAGGIRFWTQFHDAKSVALHEYAPVDGTPLSHGCVRLNQETTQMAQNIYEGARVGLTHVKVRNLAKPLCGNTALQNEWTSDFQTAGRTPPDGQTIDPYLGRRLTTEEVSRERHNIRETRQELRSAFNTKESGLDAELAAVLAGASIASKIPRCGQALKTEEHQGTLQRYATGPEKEAVPPIVHEVLRSPGQPLDAQTRAFMEPRFGHDFGNVRVHADARAAESARAINALAYTVGQDVVFGPAQYKPGSVSGNSLIAHELTHVIQQGPSLMRSAASDVLLNSDEASEKQAQDTGTAVMIDRPSGLLSHTSLQVARAEAKNSETIYKHNTELGGLTMGNFDFHFRNCGILVWVWLKFQFTKDITPAEQATYKKFFLDAVHSKWAHTGYFLKGAGNCPCGGVPIEIHAEENTGSFYHKLVDVERKRDFDTTPAPPGTGTRRPKVISDINVNFYTDALTIAHEFGHVLGLYDEYDGGFFENIMFWHQNPPGGDESPLMANGTVLRPRYFEHYRREMQKNAPKGCQYTISSSVPPVP